MKQDTDEKFKKAIELVGEGSTRTSALRSVGLAAAGGNFNKLKKLLGGNIKKHTVMRRKKKATFVDLPLPQAQSTNVAIIVTTADNLKAVLKGLS